MKTLRVTLRPVGWLARLPTSDTLFGGLCWAVHTLYGKRVLEEVLGDFHRDSRRFVCSSTFPWVPGDPPVRALPAPAGMTVDGGRLRSLAQGDRRLDILGEAKRLRTVSYVSESIVQTTALRPGEALEQYVQGALRLRGGWLVEASQAAALPVRPLEHWVQTRNAIDRVRLSTGGAGQLFHTDRVRLLPRVGLYFYLRCGDPDFIVPALKLLMDSGVGGDRSAGQGGFQIEGIEEVGLPEGRTFLSLSRYLPYPDELLPDPKAQAYTVLPWRARAESRTGVAYKAKVLYLQEGATLTAREIKPYYGTLYPAGEMKDGRPIYQCGLALPWGLHGDAA